MVVLALRFLYHEEVDALSAMALYGMIVRM